MATATKQAHGVRQVARRAEAVSDSAPIRFLVFEDNGGDYRWTILGSGGESLAQSGSFSAYDDAEQAARVVRETIGSARFQRRPAADHAVDLVSRREAAIARDES
jgi:uncharacterized protein YegP (UPF0339 family)